MDYLHILNCVCEFRVAKQIKCYDKGTSVLFGAYRLSSDMWSSVINNMYMRPSYKRPYYYIHNVNSNNQTPYVHNSTNPYEEQITMPTGTGTDVTLSTIVDEWNKFKETLPTEPILTSGYINAVVTDGTLTPQEGTYYIVTIDDVTYCILFNTITNRFYLEEKTTVELSVEEQTAIIVTNSNNIYQAQNILFINGADSTNWKILVNSEFITKMSKIAIGLPRTMRLSNGSTLDLVEKNALHRYGNASSVRLEIRYGRDDSVFQLAQVYIDYIKAPQYIRLTQEQIDLTEDTSQIMEFPDYVCQEIINELVHLLMENASDPRIQTHPIVSQSIANPTQAQATT